MEREREKERERESIYKFKFYRRFRDLFGSCTTQSTKLMLKFTNESSKTNPRYTRGDQQSGSSLSRFNATLLSASKGLQWSAREWRREARRALPAAVVRDSTFNKAPEDETRVSSHRESLGLKKTSNLDSKMRRVTGRSDHSRRFE
jgi:hypothetical protein